MSGFVNKKAKKLATAIRFSALALPGLGCASMAIAANPALYYAAPSCDSANDVIVQFKTLPAANYAMLDRVSAENIGNYTVSGRTVQSAEYNSSTNAVRLTLNSPLSPVEDNPGSATTHTVNVSGVMDINNSLMSAGSDSFQYSSNQAGMITSAWYADENNVPDLSTVPGLVWSDIQNVDSAGTYAGAIPGTDTYFNPIYVSFLVVDVGFDIIGGVFDFAFCDFLGGLFGSILGSFFGGSGCSEDDPDMLQQIDRLTTYEGFLKVTEANSYQFEATVNDGVRFYLDHQTNSTTGLTSTTALMDNWIDTNTVWVSENRSATRENAVTVTSSTLSLDNEGRSIAYLPAKIEYEYFANQVKVSNSGCGTSNLSACYEPDSGILDLEWKVGSAAMNYLGSDNFSTCVPWTPPPPPALADFEIALPNNDRLVGCAAGEVTITAINEYGGTMANYEGTVAISTSDFKGNWALASGTEANFVQGADNGGTATYTFSDEDDGEVTLRLTHLYNNPITITVNDADEAVSVVSSSLSHATGSMTIVDVSNDDPNNNGVVGAGNYKSADWDFVAGRPHKIKVGAVSVGGGTCTTSDPSHLNFAFKLTTTESNPLNAVAPRIKSTLKDATGKSLALDGEVPAIEILLTSIGTTLDDVLGTSMFSTITDGLLSGVTGTLVSTLDQLTPTQLDTITLAAASALGLTPSDRANYTLLLPDSGDFTLEVIDNVTGSTGVTDNNGAITVRPFGLSVSTSGLKDIKGNDVDLSTLDPDTGAGPALAKAGEDLKLSIVGVSWSAGDDTDNDGLPDPGANLFDNGEVANFQPSLATFSDSVASIIAPTGGVGMVSADVAEGATEVTVSFDDVGIIDVELIANDYLNAVGPIKGNLRLGRFVPHHFALATDPGDSNIGAGDELASNNDVCKFTFVGQDFSFVAPPEISLVAMNAANGITQNYRGVFNKFTNASNVPGFVLSDGGAHVLNLTPDVSSTDGGSNGKVKRIMSFGALRYERDIASLSTPFIPSDLQVPAAALTDNDGVFLDKDANNVGDSLTLDNISGTEIIFGRVVMDNVYGPENNELTVPYRTEYYKQSAGGNTGFYVLSEDENCAGIAALEPKFSEPKDKAGNNTAGSGKLDPSALVSTTASQRTLEGPKKGRYEFAIGAPGSDSCSKGDNGLGCSVAATLDVPVYLQWDHDGDGNLLPSAVATFGIYQGQNQPLIFKKQAFR